MIIFWGTSLVIILVGLIIRDADGGGNRVKVAFLIIDIGGVWLLLTVKVYVFVPTVFAGIMTVIGAPVDDTGIGVPNSSCKEIVPVGVP